MYIHAFSTVYLEFAINIFQILNYTTSVPITANAQNARARRAVQPTGFSKQKTFEHGFVKMITCFISKIPMSWLILISRNQFWDFLVAFFHKLRYTDVTTISNLQYHGWWNVLTYRNSSDRLCSRAPQA